MDTTSGTTAPWATIGLWALTLIVAAVGGAVVVWGHNGALTFEKYVEVLAGFGVAHGLLGIGRGINAHGKSVAAAQYYSAQLYAPPSQTQTEVGSGADTAVDAPPEQHV